jgi:hypothetical protein
VVLVVVAAVLVLVVLAILHQPLHRKATVVVLVMPQPLITLVAEAAQVLLVEVEILQTQVLVVMEQHLH